MKFCSVYIDLAEEAKPYVLEGKLCLISAWHSRLFLGASVLKKFGNFAMVVSSHGDGELLSAIITSYHHQAIRGSSRKKGFSAVVGIMEAIKSGTRVVITPDGPVGPRYKIKGGLCQLARKYAIPIIPICYSGTGIKILKTWDRFLLPIPFISKIVIEIGPPIFLEGELSVSEKRLEKIMLNQAISLDKRHHIESDY